MLEYPYGIDCIWIAQDKLGHLAAFLTAGDGDIPTEALNISLLPELEGIIYDELSEVAKAKLLIQVPRPDTFLGLAQRGFYVYDWVGDESKKRESDYQLVAFPDIPLKADAVINGSLSIFANLQIQHLEFGATFLNIRSYIECSYST